MEWSARIKIRSVEEIEKIMKEAPEKAQAHRHWGNRIRTASRRRAGGPGPASALAWDPELLYLWYQEEHHVLKEGNLDRGLKELITVVVDDKNQCPGCVGWHSACARVEGLSDEMIEIGRDFDRRKNELSEKVRKTIEFAVKVSTNHTKVTDGDIEELKKLGYTDSDMVEIISVALIAEDFAKVNVVLNLGSLDGQTAS